MQVEPPDRNRLGNSLWKKTVELLLLQDQTTNHSTQQHTVVKCQISPPHLN